MYKLLLAGCLSVMTFAAIAQDNPGDVVRREKLDVTATVQDIDHEKREITLKTPKGKRVVKAGDQVKNLDQIKKGDKVLATFYESVAYSVQKGDASTAPAATTEGGGVYVAERGEKPSAMKVKTKQTSAKVQSIDPQTREMTLEDPEGRTFTVTVDERAGDLRRISKGDTITANFTEAVAVSVMPKK